MSLENDYRRLREIVEEKPWLSGIIDNLFIAKELFTNGIIQTKNRVSLILIDDALELAFKNYIIKEKKFKLPINTKFRENLHKMVKKHSSFDETIWNLIDHYYSLRCDLYHEEGEKTIPNSDIENYYNKVTTIINNLFNLTDASFKDILNLQRPMEHKRDKGITITRIESIDNAQRLFNIIKDYLDKIEISHSKPRGGYIDYFFDLKENDNPDAKNRFLTELRDLLLSFKNDLKYFGSNELIPLSFCLRKYTISNRYISCPLDIGVDPKELKLMFLDDLIKHCKKYFNLNIS